MKETEEVFIRLVQLFRDDGELGGYFRKLSAMTGAERATTLARIATNMRQDGQSAEIATAAEKLAEPELWEKVSREVLGIKTSEHP